MELSSQDAAFGRNQSAEKRARGRRLWCAGAGQGSEEPRAPVSTLLADSDSHLLQHRGLPWQPYYRTGQRCPFFSSWFSCQLPSPSQDIQGESLGCITCPWDARCTPA